MLIVGQVAVEQVQGLFPAGLRLFAPSVGGQARLQRRQRPGDLHIQWPALFVVELVAARGQRLPALRPPVLQGDAALDDRCLELRQHAFHVARRVPQARQHEAAVEEPGDRLDPERPHHAAAVGDAQHQQPYQAEQHAADDVAEPVRAQVEPREADQRHDDAGDQVGPHPRASRQFACDQHREETEDDGGHGHRDRRKAEAAAHRRRLGNVHRRAQPCGQGQAERQCRQPVTGRHPALAPAQVGQHQQRDRRQHLLVAQRGQGRQRPVGQRIAQGAHQLMHP